MQKIQFWLFDIFLVEYINSMFKKSLIATLKNEKMETDKKFIKISNSN